jgi:NAD(P) transhydrogenase subunit beta
MQTELANILYLLAAILFIFGLKGLTHPRTAVRGNLLSALGMLIAVVTALSSELGLNWGFILSGLVIGSLIGVVLAVKTQMTAIPQLVALFNGFGGGASVLVAGAALIAAAQAAVNTAELTYQLLIATSAAVIIGAVTLLGSLVAFAKLAGWIKKSLVFSGQRGLNALLAAGVVFCGVMLVITSGGITWFWIMVVLASILGVLLVMPIGGADMPVVIAALNAYSGLAACGTGFVLNNNVLVIAGSLVGTSGLILTRIMCKAMNRSFTNVIFGVPMGSGVSIDADAFYEGKVKSTSADEVAMILETAQKVVVVPGYGLAVAQAQHAVRDLSRLLEAMDIEVTFAIHPVAGRMPGHMNVLLAEADIAYDKLQDLDTANPTFGQVDVSIVVGANDVVNSDARSNPDSPIAGMPILDVDKSKTVIVIKRSLSPGFAGIPNPLFIAENTLMFFGDGKVAVGEINTALKEL